MAQIIEISRRTATQVLTYTKHKVLYDDNTESEEFEVNHCPDADEATIQLGISNMLETKVREHENI